MNKFWGALLITVGFMLGLASVVTLFKRPAEKEDTETAYVISFEVAYYITSIGIIILSYFLIRTGIRLIRKT